MSKVPTTLLCTILFLVQRVPLPSYGKPTDIKLVDESAKQDSIVVTNSEITEDNVRKERSPEFGLLGGGDDYSYEDYDDDSSRHLKFAQKRKVHKLLHGTLGLIGGHGCHGCGGGPHYGGHYGGDYDDYGGDYGGHYGGHYGGQAASQASASAGAIGGPHGAPNSQSNAQSASFNFGPISASFSSAQSSAGHGRY